MFSITPHVVAQGFHLAFDAEVRGQGDGHHGDEQEIAGIEQIDWPPWNKRQQNAAEKKDHGAGQPDPVQRKQRVADHLSGEGARGQHGNAVGASTAPKKKMEPIHNASASNLMKRRTDMAEPPENDESTQARARCPQPRAESARTARRA